MNMVYNWHNHSWLDFTKGVLQDAKPAQISGLLTHKSSLFPYFNVALCCLMYSSSEDLSGHIYTLFSQLRATEIP